MARVSARPSSLDEVLYPERKGKNIDGTKIDDKKKKFYRIWMGIICPSPCWMMTCPLSSAPPGPEAALMPNAGPGGISAAAAAPLPALPEIIEPPFQQAPIPAMETSGQHPQDSTSAGSPRVYPPFP